MSETAFIKNFLSSLDSRPIKLRADYVHDDEYATPRVPFLLPRLQPPRPEMPKKIKPVLAPGSSKSITIRLKSARNPALEFSLSNAPLATTSVQDLKDAVRDRVLDANGNKVQLDKIKILYKRRPVTGKTIAEILADEPELLVGGKEVEIGVMIMGGAMVVEQGQGQGQGQDGGQGQGQEGLASTESTSKAAVGPSGEEVLGTEQFWDDLQGFLAQRIKDEEEAKRLRGLFKGAWVASR